MTVRTGFERRPVLRASVAGRLLGPLCLAIVLTTGCGVLVHSDEKDVRGAIQGYFDSFASGDIETIAKNSCGPLAATIRQAAADEGPQDDSGKRPFSMTVDSISNIQVLDDTATASVTVHSSSKPDPKSFVATVTKENRTWKYCTQ